MLYLERQLRERQITYRLTKNEYDSMKNNADFYDLNLTRYMIKIDKEESERIKNLMNFNENKRAEDKKNEYR